MTLLLSSSLWFLFLISLFIYLSPSFLSALPFLSVSLPWGQGSPAGWWVSLLLSDVFVGPQSEATPTASPQEQQRRTRYCVCQWFCFLFPPRQFLLQKNSVVSCVCSTCSRGACSPAPDEGSFQPGVSWFHLQPAGPGQNTEEQTGGGPHIFIILISDNSL